MLITVIKIILALEVSNLTPDKDKTKPQEREKGKKGKKKKRRKEKKLKRNSNIIDCLQNF